MSDLHQHPHGWVILDKPLGLTSTRAVGRIKRLFGAKKAGHAGTLDPLATGLLPIALGEACKTMPFAVDGLKQYRFSVRWGVETDTLDCEGAVVRETDVRPDHAAIEAVLPQFTGLILQTPPAYSAIKIDGERAYKRARAGGDVKLAPREVDIKALGLVSSADRDHADFEVTCAKGTYVRALARDLANALGTAGHVTALRRVAVGPFNEGHMISLEKLETIGHSGARCGALSDCLLPIETVLDDIPVLAIDPKEAALLKNGQKLVLRGDDAPPLPDPQKDRQTQGHHPQDAGPSGLVLAVSGGCPVALAEVRAGALHPKRVFNL